MIDFIQAHWEYITILILVVDKVVALSPSKKDDLIWYYIKKMIPKGKK